jgi:hypothetical protein
VQLEHPVDQVLHAAALPRDGGEVAHVLPARREGVLRHIGCSRALVAGDDDLGVQRGDRVDAGDPGLAPGLVGRVEHHVHVVVDDVAGHNGVGGRHVEDRRPVDVTLADAGSR